MEKKCGIYKIVNKVNGKIYIGESIGIEGRLIRHKSDLKNNKDSSHLQNSWNKYKEESFEFSILKECLPEELKYWEEYYIELYESWNPQKGYNIERISNGVKVISKETRKKMSENHRDISGEKNPNFGKQLSREHKRKLSELRKGKKSSIETRHKLSELRKGKKNPNFGKHPSKETRQKISEANKRENSIHSGIKLTLKEVDEIVIKYKNGNYTHRQLAKEYGVGKTTIGYVIEHRKREEELLNEQ